MMMHRTIGARRAMPGRTAACWAIVAFCAVLLTGCTGGSGSSGFDIVAAENAAIDDALDTGSCVVERGLTICASTEGEIPATATRTPTATSQPQRTSSAAPDVTRTPTDTPVAAPSQTPTGASPAPSPTGVASQPSVDIQPDASDVTNCGVVADSQSCTLHIVFVPMAAPAGAVYRAAARTRDPDSAWRIMPVEGNAVDIVVPPDVDVVQTAILLYEREPGPVPGEVEALSESGADFAFVTAPLTVRASASP
jgi:hypothetical protein